MDFEEKLSEYQKFRIKKRQKLNFDEEIKKSNTNMERKIFKKNFQKELSIFTKELHHNGVLFYGFKMNFSFSDLKDMWYSIHFNIELLIEQMKTDIELIEFCYISIDSNSSTDYNRDIFIASEIKDIVVFEKNLPVIYGIFGVRSLVGNNEMHCNEMRKLFISYDADCTLLDSIDAIENYWDFIIKESNFKFHRFTQYSDFFQDLYGSISDLELQYDSDHVAFGLDETYDSKNRDLSGILTRNPDYVTILNYLIILYLYDNKFYLNKDFLYRRKIATECSWEIVDSIDFFNKNYLNIVSSLKKSYPQQLRNFKLLFYNTSISFYSLVKNYSYLFPSVKFNNDVIEFQDGFYFFLEKKFYTFKENISSFNCNKYINSNFLDEKRKLPIKWLSLLDKQLNDKEKLTFFSSMYDYFNAIKIRNKNEILVLLNNINLVSDYFTCKVFFTKDNFIFEELNKIENYSLSIKFLVAENKNIIIDDFFINRLIIYYFSYKIIKEKKELNIILEDELISILLYCNKEIL